MGYMLATILIGMGCFFVGGIVQHLEESDRLHRCGLDRYTDKDELEAALRIEHKQMRDCMTITYELMKANFGVQQAPQASGCNDLLDREQRISEGNMEQITRDNFDPKRVLAAMRRNDPIPDPLRILEEACHAFFRLQHEHLGLILRIQAAVPRNGVLHE